MTDEKELQPGLVISARYRIERRLGSGGMGSVYLVQHVHTEERFALKVLHKAVISDSNALERFRREARTPARIDSEYVVRVTDADAAQELGGAPFLVMEYLRGEDIDQRIERAGAFSPGSAVNLLKQACKALDKAHGLGIVHRDLKPENLFIVEREDGTHIIKILDFGIAKFTVNQDDQKISAATRPGAVFGTPLFMSPEQAIDSSKVSSRTDIWALGLIAFRMLTGRDYWTAESLTQLIAQIAYEPLVAASERGATLGPEFDRWFAKCCARKPEDRYATAGEAVRELSAALGLSDVSVDGSFRAPISVLAPVSAKTDVNVLSDTQLATTQARRSERSRGGLLGVAGVAVVGLIALGFFLTRGTGDAANAKQSPTAEPAPTSATTPEAARPASSTSPVVAPVSAAPTESAVAPPPPSAEPSAEAAVPSAPKPLPGGSVKAPTGPRPSAAPGPGPKPTPAPQAPKPSGSDPFGSRF
jgi:serine/threonine protein kinase